MAKSSSNAASSKTVKFKNLYDIDIGAPLPELDTITGKAFSVEQKSELGFNLYALVCESNLPLNIQAMESLRGAGGEGVLALIDWGLADWPNDSGSRLVLIYQRPGEKVVKDLTKPIRGMSDEEIMEQLIAPLVDGLSEYHSRGIPHRGIRPDNIYYNHDSDKFILGDTLSMLPGMAQPRWVETIEQGMCSPAGRGAGHFSDDMYNLGATILYFGLGRNPTAEMDPEKLIIDKINNGSFDALIRKLTLHTNTDEIVSGLLNDDVQLRWTLDDLKALFTQNRPLPKQKRTQRSASRPFPFGGYQHLNIRSLAYSMSKDWASAIDVVGSKALDRWIRRSIGDEKLADEVQVAVGTAGVSQGATDVQRDVMLSRVLLVLDKTAPLRYRNLSTTVEGMGAMIATSMSDNDRINIISHIITKKVSKLYLQTRAFNVPNSTNLAGLYDTLVNVFNKRGPGFGIERCLYELNPDLSCQGIAFKNRFVLTTKQLLLTLEDIAGSQNRPESPIDRHTAAFIAGRHKGEIKDGDLIALGYATDAAARNISMAKLLARVQMLTGNEPLPKLCEWVVQLLTPAVSSYKNIRRRKRIEAAVKKAASSGEISQIVQQIDNDMEKERDMQEYTRASGEYAAIVDELGRLDSERENKKEIAQFKGEQISVSMAAVIATFIIIMLLSTQIG